MFLLFVGGVRLQALYFKPAHLLVEGHAHPTTLSHKSASFASVQRNILLHSALPGHPICLCVWLTDLRYSTNSCRASECQPFFYGVLLFTLSRQVAKHTIPWLTSSVRNKRQSWHADIRTVMPFNKPSTATSPRNFVGPHECTVHLVMFPIAHLRLFVLPLPSALGAIISPLSEAICCPRVSVRNIRCAYFSLRDYSGRQDSVEVRVVLLQVNVHEVHVRQPLNHLHAHARHSYLDQAQCESLFHFMRGGPVAPVRVSKWKSTCRFPLIVFLISVVLITLKSRALVWKIT